MYVNEAECEKAGLSEKEVEKIAKGLSRYALMAKKLGLGIFGGSGSGTLRYSDDSDSGPLIVAGLDGDFDGGDGAELIDVLAQLPQTFPAPITQPEDDDGLAREG